MSRYSIFIENRLYKKIEECKTYEAVIKAVFKSLEPFRPKLKRDVTHESIGSAVSAFPAFNQRISRTQFVH